MNKLILFIFLCVVVTDAGISDQFNFGITYHYYQDSFPPGLKNSQHQLGFVATFKEKQELLYFGLEAGTNTWVTYNNYKDYSKNDQYFYQFLSGLDSLHVTKQLYFKENSNGFYLTPFLTVYYKHLIVSVGSQFDINYRSCSFADSVYSYSLDSNAYVYNYSFINRGWRNFWNTSISFRYSIGFKFNHFAITLISYDFLQRVGLSLSVFLKPI